MTNPPDIRFYSVVLDCPDPRALADFYARLMGWIVVFEDDEYVVIAPEGVCQGGYPGMTFQKNPDYVPPVWPSQPGAQQQMAHLDFAVENIAQAAAFALSLGASEAPEQFSGSWRVMIDPCGHPFCLCDMGIRRLPGFALK